MRLYIDTITKTVSVIDEAGRMTRITYGQFYPLPAEELRGTYRYIVHWKDSATLTIVIIRGNNTVKQKGRVRWGEMNGSPDRNTRAQPFVIELHPERKIYPVSAVIDTLTQAGIPLRRICSMHEQPANIPVVYPDMQMQTDGEFETFLQPGSETMIGATVFIVQWATWAILYSSAGIFRIYLWNGAEDEVDTLTAKVRELFDGA